MSIMLGYAGLWPALSGGPYDDQGLRRQDAGVAVQLACHDGPAEVLGSHLLLAVGRQPNTDDLGLDTAGIATDGRGFISVDEQLRTSAPGVWALGDVNGRGAFTHTAYNDYEVVAANLLDDDPRRVSDRIPAYALDPPLGRAGLTEQQARETGRPVLVGKLVSFLILSAPAETEADKGAQLLNANLSEAKVEFRGALSEKRWCPAACSCSSVRTVKAVL